jgi:GTP cyclohydrolase III
MKWGTTRFPTFSGGTIITHLNVIDSTETFSCRVLAGSWDDQYAEFKKLGPYDTYEKALIALVEYGSELLENDRYALDKRREFINDINEARQEGITQGTLKIAGFSVDDIIKATNITADDIHRL